MISILVERIARVLAARRVRAVEAMRQRKQRQKEAGDAEKAAVVAYERDHYEERLRLGRELIDAAPRFAQTPEAQWAFDLQGRWWLCGWGLLYVDRRGRLWRWSDKHWFYAPPDKLMESPETIAAAVTTNVLRAALSGIRQSRSSFWWTALLEEVLYRLGQRGRPV